MIVGMVLGAVSGAGARPIVALLIVVVGVTVIIVGTCSMIESKVIEKNIEFFNAIGFVIIGGANVFLFIPEISD